MAGEVLRDEQDLTSKPVERFLSNDARHVRCVRESDYDALLAEYNRLKRGEFICSRCQLRKNHEHGEEF